MSEFNPITQNKKICDALGLPPEKVRKVVLTFEPDAMPRADVTMYIDKHTQDTIEKTIILPLDTTAED